MANEFKIKKGLIVQGSGSTILDIQGSQGQLFSVTDQLSGSLFSVNDISGLPILQVSSDDSVKLGTFNAEAIKVLGTNTTIASGLVVTGSTTAVSAIARGTNIAPTLVAAANNDTLVGLDINPTFTNGAFTGVTNYWLQLQGNGSINGTNQIKILRNGSNILSATSLETNLSSTGTVTPLKLSLSSGALTMGQFMATTGNFILQNSGTFTDDGVNRLQVSGSARITNNLTVTGSITAPSITGSLFGTASFTEAARTVEITTQDTTAIAYNITFTGGSTGNHSLNVDPTTLKYTPGTTTLTVTNLEGTASLAKTAVSSSYALTASYALNSGGGGGAAFPYTGSAVITGSLTVTGSLAVNGAFYDSSNSPGTNGTVLTSVASGTGTQWTGVTGTGFGLTVAMTLGLQNIF